MLLRNIDRKKLGLCNGTRLIVTRVRKFVLEGKVISGSNTGEKVSIPRLSLSPSDVKIPFKFQRRQFLLVVSFAMTVNKSQGQSLKNVGFFFAKSCIFAWLALRCNFKSHFKRQVKDTNVWWLKLNSINNETTSSLICDHCCIISMFKFYHTTSIGYYIY